MLSLYTIDNYFRGPFKYHITLFWTFVDPTPISHHSQALGQPPPFSRVRIHIATKFASHFSVFFVAFLVVFSKKILY